MKRYLITILSDVVFMPHKQLYMSYALEIEESTRENSSDNNDTFGKQELGNDASRDESFWS